MMYEGSEALREYGIDCFVDTMDLSEMMISSRFRWKFCGIYATEHSYPAFSGEHLINVWTIYYKSIVIPLTLLSAYLLLSKPNHPKPTAVTQV